jgi:hypothetical protein
MAAIGHKPMAGFKRYNTASKDKLRTLMEEKSKRMKKPLVTPEQS